MSVLSSGEVLSSRMHRALGLVAAITLLASGLPALRLQPVFASRSSALDLAPVDANVLQVVARIAPHVHVVAAMVVDIDHDGDLDVIARTTDDVLAIWVNEGQGGFVKYQPSTAPKMAAAAEVSLPAEHGVTLATPARGGYDAYLVASGFARPPTTKSGGSVIARTVRLDQFSTPGHGRAPPRVSSL